MNRIRAVLLLALCVAVAWIALAQTTKAADLAAMSRDELGVWMMTYYRNPAPDEVSAFLDRIARDRFLADAWAGPPILGFLSGVQRVHPELTPVLLKHAATLPDLDRGAIQATVIWAGAGLPEAGSPPAVTKMRNRFLIWGEESGIQGVESVTLLTPNALDFQWGVFFATGDTAALSAFPSILPDMMATDQPLKQIVAAAAGWGLTAVGSKHEPVRQFCRDQIAQQPAEISRMLRSILVEAEKVDGSQLPAYSPLSTRGG